MSEATIDSSPPEAAPTVQAELTAQLPNGAELRLLSEGAALVDPQRHSEPLWLSPHAHLRVRRGPVWWRLELGDQTYVLRASAARRCLEVLALGRLRSTRSVDARPVRRGALTNLERAALDSIAEPDELLLIVYPAEHQLRGHSRAEGAFSRPALFFLSERRCLLFAVSKAGSVHLQELAPPFVFDGRTLTSSTYAFKVPAALSPIVECVPLPEEERTLEVLRRLWLSSVTASEQVELERLLHTLRQRDERAEWLSFFLEAERDGEISLPDALSAREPGIEPGALWENWRFGTASLTAVLKQRPNTDPWNRAVEDWVERALNIDIAGAKGEPHALAEARLAFAERLLLCGKLEKARDVLNELAGELERPTALDVVVPGSLPNQRVALVQKLEALRFSASQSDPERYGARRRQLSLAPLDTSLLSELAAPIGPVSKRAKDALELLSRGAQVVAGAAKLDVQPLPADVIERRLADGLGAEDTDLGGKLQAWIAKERRPEVSMLKHYCERVTRSDAPILQVVDEVATLLGVGHVEVYLSRGVDDVGVRAYSDIRPFLLVGGQHMEQSSRYEMTLAELRFAVGVELLHLRIGNTRISKRDVWRGAFHTGKQGLDVALGVLPLLQSLRLANRLSLITAKLSLPQVGRALEGARKVKEVLAVDDARHPSEHGLSPAAEKLVEQQRSRQLWADRAGLLCCGSLSASVRAILITRQDTARAAQEIVERGVLEVVERHRKAEPEAFEYLLLRLANLVAFYLSDDYAEFSALSGVRSLVD